MENEEITILQNHISMKPKCVMIVSISAENKVKVDISSKGAVSDLLVMRELIMKNVDEIFTGAFKKEVAKQ